LTDVAAHGDALDRSRYQRLQLRERSGGASWQPRASENRWANPMHRSLWTAAADHDVQRKQRHGRAVQGACFEQQTWRINEQDTAGAEAYA
jgi:hypothetical protein